MPGSEAVKANKNHVLILKESVLNESAYIKTLSFLNGDT